MITRRAFAGAIAAVAAAALASRPTRAAEVARAQNVVLVHGLFADGSCWSEVIPRLQAAGLNVTSVQNPLTTLPEAVAAAERVLARQDGPTVFVGHSFSGMIVTESRRASQRLGAGLCGNASAGCRRGLHRLGQNIPNAAGQCRHRVRRR